MFDFFKKHWRHVLLGVGIGALISAAILVGTPVLVMAGLGAVFGALGLGFYSLCSGERFTLAQYALAGLIGGIVGGLGIVAFGAVEATAAPAAVECAVAHVVWSAPLVVPPVALAPEGTPGPSLDDSILDYESVRTAALTRRGEAILRARDSARAAAAAGAAAAPSRTTGLAGALPGQ